MDLEMAGRKSIDLNNYELQQQLRKYLQNLSFLKANDERCKKHFENDFLFLDDKIQKDLKILRRDMLADQKRQAVLNRIRNKQNLDSTEKMALDLAANDDRDSFFLLQKTLDLLVSTESDKKIIKDKQANLKKQVERAKAPKVKSLAGKDQDKYFIGACFIQLRKQLAPQMSDLDFLEWAMIGAQMWEGCINGFKMEQHLDRIKEEKQAKIEIINNELVRFNNDPRKPNIA